MNDREALDAISKLLDSDLPNFTTVLRIATVVGRNEAWQEDPK